MAPPRGRAASYRQAKSMIATCRVYRLVDAAQPASPAGASWQQPDGRRVAQVAKRRAPRHRRGDGLIPRAHQCRRCLRAANRTKFSTGNEARSFL
jgi:hypothetical protein